MRDYSEAKEQYSSGEDGREKKAKMQYERWVRGVIDR